MFSFILLKVRILNQFIIFQEVFCYSYDNTHFESNHHFSRGFLFIPKAVRILNKSSFLKKFSLFPYLYSFWIKSSFLKMFSIYTQSSTCFNSIHHFLKSFIFIHLTVLILIQFFIFEGVFYYTPWHYVFWIKYHF